MKRLARLALRLYPAAWRRRYGDEMHALLEDGRTAPADVIDLVAAAARARVRAGLTLATTGGIAMLDRLPTHSRTFALVGFVAVAPTALFVSAGILKYVFGVPAPFDTLEPVVGPVVRHPLGETLVILAPYVALALALLPVARVRLGRQGGTLNVDLAISAPVVNVAVGLVSGALIVFMAFYWVAENL